MEKLLFITIILIIINQKLSPQVTISGTITDKETGENLIGASIYESNSKQGTITNLYGFYSLKITPGKCKLQASYVGYLPHEQNIEIRSDTTIHFQLETSNKLEEVVITENSAERNVRTTQMGMLKLTPVKAKLLPVLLGETDIIKTLQLMPGVQGGTEGGSGMYVRGGGPDQNLILLDGVTVYNVNHLFGFMSVFNTDAINNVSLIKGGFPARYGGRLSSVLDIRMKEGNLKEFHGEGSIGIISSNLTLEGPVVKDKTSFMISGRRSYLDILTYPIQMLINKASYTNGRAYFGYFLQDFNGKINHRFSDKSRLYLSFYSGKDKFFLTDKYKEDQGYINDEVYSYDDEMGLKWGNFTSALRWNYLFSNELFSNLTFTVSNYKFSVFEDFKSEIKSDSTARKDEYFYEYYSQIRDYGVKYDFDFIPNPNHYIKFGFSNTLHLFTPGVTVTKERYTDLESGIDTTFGKKDIPSNEFFVYIEDDLKIGNTLQINAGLHFSHFHVQNTNYRSLEPRLSARLLLWPNLSLKASYVKMQQYLHLLSNSTLGLPTDLWVPPTSKVKPQKAWQAAFGISYSIRNNYHISLEGYYKDMWDLIDYSEGASFFDLNQGSWEEIVTTGRGNSYGMELFFEKTRGKTTGWIGYTLSWSNRTFPEVSFGRTFPYKYDSRHDFSFVLTQKIKENIDLGVTWVYRTGYPFTLEDEKFISPGYLFTPKEGYWLPEDEIKNMYYQEDLDDKLLDYSESRNSYRMPHYHRLDVGIRFNKQKERYKRTWSLGAYNLYSRMNPFFIYQSYEYSWVTNESYPVMRQISILPIVPYVRWSIKF